MNKGRARFASLSVILSALFLGGCVLENGYEETEEGIVDQEEAAGIIEDAPALEAEGWIWADFCEDDEETEENECR